MAEPWQMTQAEYSQWASSLEKRYNEILGKPVDSQSPVGRAAEQRAFSQLKKETGLTQLTFTDMAGMGHKAKVRLAIEEGKPVPPEVLKDYPDLVLKESEGNPDRVRFDRASIDSAIAAAKRLESEKDLYVFATHLGYTIDHRPPPGMQSYVIVHPDGSTETIKPFESNPTGNPVPEVKFIGITKSTDPTQKRAPWRIEYEKGGKRYARYETSHVKAIQLAEEKFGKPSEVEEIKLSDKMVEIPLVEGKAVPDPTGDNPRGKLIITKEEAIGLLERLSMTPGEAARSLVADEAERREIMQTVQQRVKREQNKWAPMDPRKGPPLPRIFAGLRWPWKSEL